jgi:hypothetical protein
MGPLAVAEAVCRAYEEGRAAEARRHTRAHNPAVLTAMAYIDGFKQAVEAMRCRHLADPHDAEPAVASDASGESGPIRFGND